MVDFISLENEKKEKVLQGAAKLRPEEREEVLSQALVDPGLTIRERAVEQIALLKVEALYPSLFWQIRTPEERIRRSIRRILLALPLDHLRKIVYPELGSVLYTLRMAAADLIAERGSLEDFEAVLPLLFDYKIDVRDKARRALKCLINREIEACETEAPVDYQQPMRSRITPSLQAAMRWLFRLVDGPDHVTASTAGNILIDVGNLDPHGFWDGYNHLSLKGREILFRLIAQREDASVLRLLYLGLLFDDERVASKSAKLIFRQIQRQGGGAHLQVLGQFEDRVQSQLARRMALDDLIPELLNRFDSTPVRLRDVVFDLLEHLDCREYLPFLESCIKQQEDLLVFRALRLLIPLESRNYLEDFLPLLTRDDPDILLLVLEYLRRRGDVSLIPKLSPLLAHRDERVTRATISTVFYLSRQHLLSRYEDLNSYAREEIVKLLHRLDEHFVDSLCEDITGLSSQEKIHLVNILEILGQESKIQPTLLKLSREPDRRVRATVARALKLFSEAKQKLELTRNFLQDEDTRVRANVVESIENVEDQEILQHLIRMAHSANGRERANSIKKLWEKGYRDFELSLVQMANEPNEWTRASALWVLGEIEAPHLIDVIQDALNDSNPVVRENAIRALGKQGAIDQVRQLTRYLEDADRRVREAARDVMRKRMNLSYEIR